MYSEPFQFSFSPDLLDSKRMSLMAEIFEKAEAKNIKNESFGGYKIYNTGEVKFTSYLPELTSLVVEWLSGKEAEGKLQIIKPKYAKYKNA